MIKGRAVQYLAALAVSLATASMGTYSCWATPMIPKLAKNESNFVVTQGEINWMLASNSPGFISGSIVTRFISEQYGRRTTLLASAGPMILGTVMVVSATNAVMLYATKFLWGVSTGMISTVATIYLVEIADMEIRASLSVGTRFMFNFAVLLVMSVGPFLSYQLLNSLLFVLPLCYFVACLWIPESPYYYLKEGKVNHAREGLLRLTGKSGEALELHLKELQTDVNKETQKSSSVYELFSGRWYRRAIVIAAGLKITQILTGTVTIKHYLGMIIEEGQMSLSISTSLIIFAAIQFVVSLVSSFFVDRVGRVPLLVYSYFATGLCFTLVGTYFFFQGGASSSKPWLQPFSYVAFIAIVISNVVATVGFSTITMIVHAEIFPLNVKDVAMMSLNIFGGCLAIVVTKAYEGIKNLSGLHGVFWVFAGLAFAGSLFSALMVPETRGKSLKEIQEILQGHLYDDSNAHCMQDISKDLIPKSDNTDEEMGESHLMKESDPK